MRSLQACCQLQSWAGHDNYRLSDSEETGALVRYQQGECHNTVSSLLALSGEAQLNSLIIDKSSIQSIRLTNNWDIQSSLFTPHLSSRKTFHLISLRKTKPERCED